MHHTIYIWEKGAFIKSFLLNTWNPKINLIHTIPHNQKQQKDFIFFKDVAVSSQVRIRVRKRKKNGKKIDNVTNQREWNTDQDDQEESLHLFQYLHSQ